MNRWPRVNSKKALLMVIEKVIGSSCLNCQKRQTTSIKARRRNYQRGSGTIAGRGLSRSRKQTYDDRQTVSLDCITLGAHHLCKLLILLIFS